MIDENRPNFDVMLQFFAWQHLPADLQPVSKVFHALASHCVQTLPRNPERTVALRKLLEAKDCAVRSLLWVGVEQPYRSRRHAR